MIFFLFYIFVAISVTISFIFLLVLRALIFQPKFENCAIYEGRVHHTRLKGGGCHTLDYPIFFVYIDLNEIIKCRWSMWPIFSLNSGWLSFCSLDDKDHMKEISRNNDNLGKNVLNFVDKTINSSQESIQDRPIFLLTHLTYFGYCFNPVSFYYIFQDKSCKSIDTIIAEVSNTPWNEQHSYILNERSKDVKFTRKSDDTINATWHKEFHVSPFMEMDYIYDFTFSLPRDEIWVKSKLLKQDTKEVWLTANFKLKKQAFNCENLLYYLFYYPLHTRIIQIWIHVEAIKIWFKGIPLFAHPKDSDVDFGLGITGKRIAFLISIIVNALQYLLQGLGFKKDKFN